ncbi:hypothetical protein E2C01_101002 [Portunus trituberculatus]|uniref:Uncharacterized protein n=1 Tax=Portunus trituberculatus TaxID=210409 RepID=A0A5B7KJD0_PORTR|nr:hypothetical protein [Portunus trituberculatus]
MPLTPLLITVPSPFLLIPDPSFLPHFSLFPFFPLLHQ